MTMTLVHSGKVRELYDVGDDRLLMVASDRISAFDVDPGRADPRQGEGAHGHDRALAGRVLATSPPAISSRPTRPARQRPPPSRRPGSTTSRAAPCSCAGPRCSPSSASCAAIWRDRGGRSTRRRATLHGTPAPTGLRQADRLARAHVHPLDQGDRGPRHEHLVRRGGRAGGQGAGRAGTRRCASRPTGVRRERWRSAGHHRGRHQVRARLHRRRPGPLRRGPHPRLLAVLARRRVASRGPTPPSFDKQPVRDWLEASGWDKSRRHRPLPGGGGRETSERVHRPLTSESCGRRSGRLVRCGSEGEVRRARRGATASRDRRSAGRDDRAGPAGARFRRGATACGVGKAIRFESRPSTSTAAGPQSQTRWLDACSPTRSSRMPRSPVGWREAGAGCRRGEGAH